MYAPSKMISTWGIFEFSQILANQQGDINHIVQDFVNYSSYNYVHGDVATSYYDFEMHNIAS